LQGAALYVAHRQSVGLYINLYTIKERFVKLEIPGGLWQMHLRNDMRRHSVFMCRTQILIKNGLKPKFPIVLRKRIIASRRRRERARQLKCTG